MSEVVDKLLRESLNTRGVPIEERMEACKPLLLEQVWLGGGDVEVFVCSGCWLFWVWGRECTPSGQAIWLLMTPW